MLLRIANTCFFERTKRTWDEVDVCSVNTVNLGGQRTDS